MFWMVFLVMGSPSLLAQEENAVKFRVRAIQAGNSEMESLSNEVAIRVPLQVFIPQAFSPNGDGLNDTFGVVAESIGAFELSVFDRWGKLLFATNDPSENWDGRFQNELQPVGAYVYRVRADGGQSGTYFKEGTIMLVN